MTDEIHSRAQEFPRISAEVFRNSLADHKADLARYKAHLPPHIHAYIYIHTYNYPAVGAARTEVSTDITIHQTERIEASGMRWGAAGEGGGEERKIRRRRRAGENISLGCTRPVPRRPSSLNGSTNRLAPGTRLITDFFLAADVSPHGEKKHRNYTRKTLA
jgi:hypothetical protein